MIHKVSQASDVSILTNSRALLSDCLVIITKIAPLVDRRKANLWWSNWRLRRRRLEMLTLDSLGFEGYSHSFVRRLAGGLHL